VRLILVRHGESEWNAAGRVQGQADPDLSPAGREEARLVGPLVRSLEPETAVTSDLRRAVATGALLVDGAGTDPLWRESAMGDWTGRPAAELYADPSGRFAAWREGRADPPGGETWQQMCDRVAGAAAALRASGAARALVVTHGGPVRAACAVLAGLRPDQLVPVPNASVTIIDLARPGRLVAFAVRPAPVASRPRPPADA
jgi:glucosyl-3-phosphoglycerate phosphatase